MTDDIDLGWLFATLAAMLAVSGFFSMSETCMMALNRYRLNHLIREGHIGARLAGKLLDRTDELLSFILAGNTVIYVLPGSNGACRDGWDKLISLQLDSRHRPCSILEAIPRFQKR